MDEERFGDASVLSKAWAGLEPLERLEEGWGEMEVKKPCTRSGSSLPKERGKKRKWSRDKKDKRS